RMAVFFLPPDEARIAAFFAAMKPQETAIAALDFHRVYILPLASPALKEMLGRLQLNVMFLADETRGLHAAFGLNAQEAAAFLVTAGYKITDIIREADAASSLARVIAAFGNSRHVSKLTFDGTAPHAPVLIVPDALPKALQEEILAYWQQGKQ